MGLINSKLIEYAQSDLYCRKDGLYANISAHGLYENRRDAFIDGLVKNVSRFNEDACKDIDSFELRDRVSREYDEYLLSESNRLSFAKASEQELGDSLFLRACFINGGLLHNSLTAKMIQKGRELTDEETIEECLNLFHANIYDYWKPCTHILDQDKRNTSFPMFRELIESLPYSESFPSQEAFDDCMESVRKDSPIDHVLLHKDSCDLLISYKDGFYYLFVTYDLESIVFEEMFHNDAESVILDKFRDSCPEESLSGCWSDLLHSNGLDQEIPSKIHVIGDPIELSLDGLHKAFERFQDDGKFGACGDWEIERVIISDKSSSERTEWVASFQHQAVAKCSMVIMPTHISGYENLKRMANISDKSFSDFCDIAISFAPHKYRMASTEMELIAEHNRFFAK